MTAPVFLQVIQAILLILTTTTAAATSSSAEKEQKWTQWSCDDLTPHLCELDVTTESLDIQGIPVKYWRYSKKKAAAGKNGGN